MALSYKVEKPYVGPRPFERGERHLFFGRDREVSDILSLIIASRTFLIYAQSGAGKSSLLNAQIIPNLESRGNEVLPVARVRGVIPESIDPGDIANIYLFNTLVTWEGNGTFPRELTKVQLADFLKKRPHPENEDGMLSPRVVIFDQFEELFTFFPERWKDREQFFEQIATALSKDPVLRVVFVMREDYIAELDPYSSLLPERLKTRYRIERLRRKAALDAVRNPLQDTRCAFDEGVAEKLVDELLTIWVQDRKNKEHSHAVTGEFVEPVQLQVVCENLWNGIQKEATKISEQDLAAFGDVNQALSNFYERSIQKVKENLGVSEGMLRRWFEFTLITPAGTRGTVYQGNEYTGESEKLQNDVVDALENLHIIRGELRGGARWFELAHDRFIKPILKSNQKWRASQGDIEETRRKLEDRAALWVEQGRLKEDLLEDGEIEEADAWLATPAAADLGCSEILRVFLQSSRAEIESRRAEAQEKTAKKFRRFSFFLSLAVLFAIGAFLFAWNQKNLADANANKAREAEKVAAKNAKDAREAEKVAAKNAKDAREAEKLAAKNAKDAIGQAKLAAKNAKEARRAEKLAAAKAREAEAAKTKTESLMLKGQKQKQLLDSRRLAAAAVANIISNPTRGTLLALHAVSRSTPPLPEALSALHRALESEKFDKWTILHEESLIIDDKQLNPSKRGDILAKTRSRKKDLPSHGSKVLGIAFSKDGTLLATSSADKTAKVWDIRTRRKVYTITDHLGLITGVAFSPDGSLLATSSTDSTAKIWEAKSGKLLQVLREHTAAVTNVRFSPSSTDLKLATSSKDGIAIIWKVNPIDDQHEMIPLRKLRKYMGEVVDVAFNSDGSLVGTAHSYDIATVWDSTSGEELMSFERPVGRVNSIEFSPDNQYLLTAGSKGPVQMVQLALGGKSETRGALDSTGTLDVVYSPNGKQFAAASMDGSVEVWNVAKGKETQGKAFTFSPTTGAVNQVAFSDNGDLLATGNSDGTVRIYLLRAEDLWKFAMEHVNGQLTTRDCELYLGTPNCPDLITPSYISP